MEIKGTEHREKPTDYKQVCKSFHKSFYSAGTATVKQSYVLTAGPGIDPAEDPEIKGDVQVKAR